MRILRNYILKDFFSGFIFAFLSLTMVMLLGNIMKISDMVIRKGVNFLDAFKIFLFFFPYLLSFTFPLSFLLAVLLTMGRMIADNELVAIHVAGISYRKILSIFLIIGIIFSLSLFLLNDRVVPDFHFRYRSQLKSIYSKNINALIEPRIFLEHFENYILYVSDKDGNKLENVFIYEIDERNSSSKVTFAKEGEFIVEDNMLKMKLENGFRDETNPQKPNEFYRLNFKVFFMNIPIKEEEETTRIDKKPTDMTLRGIKEKMNSLRRKGINPVEMEGEFHKRISFSFSILVFILLGFGVSLVVRHREKSINFGIAFFAAGIYYLLFVLGETFLDYRWLPPIISMWLPNIIMGGIGIILIKKNAAFR